MPALAATAAKSDPLWPCAIYQRNPPNATRMATIPATEVAARLNEASRSSLGRPLSTPTVSLRDRTSERCQAPIAAQNETAEPARWRSRRRPHQTVTRPRP